ncbi:hypothetical protein [Mobilibacterium timonense]|uniref:hypothetical protein n=1 Tax=Mobilibacterium timonense TaxID=1871012 RepID=UPI003A92706C
MPNWAKIVILIAACLITFPSDWSTIAMICPFYLYQHRGKFRLQTRDIVILIAVYAAVYFLFLDKLYGVLQMFTFLTIPILAGYNGERGRWKGMKWLFLHLLPGASCCDWGSPTCAGWQCADYFLTFAGTYWFGQKDMLMHGFIGFTHKTELQLSEEVDSAEWVPALEAPKIMFPDKPGVSLYEVYHSS